MNQDVLEWMLFNIHSKIGLRKRDLVSFKLVSNQHMLEGKLFFTCVK